MLEQPYQNPAAAAAIFAMHQSPSAHSAQFPHYNYMQPQSRFNPPAIPHPSDHVRPLQPPGTPSVSSPFYNPNISPTHSLSRLPNPQEFVAAAAKRLNEQIYASKPLSDDPLNTLKGT